MSEGGCLNVSWSTCWFLAKWCPFWLIILRKKRPTATERAASHTQTTQLATHFALNSFFPQHLSQYGLPADISRLVGEGPPLWGGRRRERRTGELAGLGEAPFWPGPSQQPGVGDIRHWFYSCKNVSVRWSHSFFSIGANLTPAGTSRRLEELAWNSCGTGLATSWTPRTTSHSTRPK